MRRVLLLAGLLSLAAFTATALASPGQIAPVPTPPPLPGTPLPATAVRAARTERR